MDRSIAEDAAKADLDMGVIYTYEDRLLTTLLETLAASGDDISTRLILVDNASDDGVARWRNHFEQTTVVRNEQRLGYGPNLNRILDFSTARYTLLLNTDMRFDPQEQCLTKLVRFMDARPECGVSGCRLYHDDGSFAFPARRFQTLRMIAARRLGRFGKAWQAEADRMLYRDRDPKDVFECDWLSGCLLMVRREATQQVGGFDERFAKYFEDVDFCARMSAAGWRVMYNGETYGYHLEQRGSKRLFSKDAWLHMKSYVAWLRKWGFDPGRKVERLSKAA